MSSLINRGPVASTSTSFGRAQASQPDDVTNGEALDPITYISNRGTINVHR